MAKICLLLGEKACAVINFIYTKGGETSMRRRKTEYVQLRPEKVCGWLPETKGEVLNKYPSLIEVQKDSYNWFLKRRVKGSF